MGVTMIATIGALLMLFMLFISFFVAGFLVGAIKAEGAALDLQLEHGKIIAGYDALVEKYADARRRKLGINIDDYPSI